MSAEPSDRNLFCCKRVHGYSPVASSLYSLYRLNADRLRKIILSLVLKLEKGEPFSPTLRRIFRDYHKVDIGLYTHGGCFTPGALDKFTTVGRYCSIARTARTMNRNHPMEFKSTHAFFFNPIFGCCKNDLIEYVPLNIGSDVWLGHGAIISPSVRNIGHGAVVAAGAVVHKDVPPYAVVVGNPSRVVRFRFSKEVIEELLESRWWELSIEDLKPRLNEFQGIFEKTPRQTNEVPHGSHEGTDHRREHEKRENLASELPMAALLLGACPEGYGKR